MSTEKWDLVNDLFHAALELEPSLRSQFLHDRCDDPVVLNEVKLLLDAHQEAGSFIETPMSILNAELPEAEELLMPDEMIGVYKIVKEIGRGGMGAVYLASRADHAYEKHVAVKVLKSGMDTAEVLRHFRNERQILADFDHPNIARLLDGGTTNSGVPYFVMEYVEGMPIDVYCDHHQLTVTQRLDLFRQVCAAVSYAHRHLVIHRDIKPSNVLVTAEGTPKLLDFGIAKILHHDGQSASTATGIHLMTPEYASPEQIFGHPVTTVSDVYSLGVLLFELVTGRLPYQFDTRSPIEIARIIHDTQPPLPSATVHKTEQLKRGLRGDLDNVISMAIRKEPQRRYQSVEQFSEDIRRHLARLPVLARKDTIVYRFTKFAKRNPISVTAIAIVFLTLFAGVIATTWQAQKAKAEQSRAEYAREFADELRYIESLLLSAYTAPLHDIRATLRMAQSRLKHMEQRTAQGGESAYGSGHNALGNGFLMLKEYERAEAHLEKSWNSGYRAPSTAYALGKVKGILYQQAITDADRLTNAQLKQQAIKNAESKYAQPAIEFLNEARRFAESPAYVEGLIALYKKRYDEALRKTSQALKYSSRPYEVMKLEGDIHFEMGRIAMEKGDRSSVASYTLAGKAYARAAESARSDADIYLADGKRLTRTIAAHKGDAAQYVEMALVACNNAIQINPDNDLPYIYKSEVYAQQGINQMYQTAIDPRAAFRSSIEQAEKANRKKQSSSAHNQAGNGYLRIGEYELANNLDPGEALNKAIAESNEVIRLDPNSAEPFIQRATIYFLISENQLVRGQDPTRALKKIIEIYDTNLRSIPKDTYACNLLALANMGLAEFKLKRGGNPHQDLQKAIAHYHQGLRMNPSATNLYEGLGLVYVDVAKNEINNGIVPDKTFDEAINAYNKSNPKGWAMFNRGVAYLTRAEYKVRVKADAKADLKLAETDFQAALELMPDLSPAILQSAAVHLLQARQEFNTRKNPVPELTQAKKKLNQYMQIDPTNAEAFLLKGKIDALNARWSITNHQDPQPSFNQAIANIQKSVDLNPSEVAAYLEMALIYRYGAEWFIQNRQSSEQWIDLGLQKTMEAEKINPDHTEIPAIRSTLLKLKSRISKDAALSQKATDLLQQALQRNPLLKAEYGE